MNTLKHTIFSIVLILFMSFISLAQRGKDGSYTVQSTDEILNAYTFLTTDANSGDASIFVDNNQLNVNFFSSPLSQGDLILIVQMQGASMDVVTLYGPTSGYTAQASWSGFGLGGTSPDWLQDEYGQVINYNNAGNFEYAEVESITGTNEIILSCALTKNYTAAGHVQIVRVPRFENLTVPNNLSVTAPNWDGDTGGVVALDINGNLDLQGNAEISTEAKGFRGGVIDGQSAVTADVNSQGFLGSDNPTEGAEKGEGIGGFYTEYDALFSRYCRGALANGGGGANYHNAGGGGGSNVGVGIFTGNGVPDPGATNQFVAAWDLEDPNLLLNPSAGGGKGGYSSANTNNNELTTAPNNTVWGADARRFTGGVGGHPLTYDPERIFMGGGGGAGDDNDDQGGDGGAGGGIVFINLYGDLLGSGAVNVNGGAGLDATGTTPPAFSNAKSGDDGAGGGGGGGAIFISNANPISNSISLLAEGGKGGNQNIQLGNFAAPQGDGPGGGGAGGMISFSTGNPVQSVIGGEAGVTNSPFFTNFPMNGATGGAAGMDDLSTPFYDLIVENDTLCDIGATSLTVQVVGTLPAGSIVDWYDAPVGGNLVHSGLNFTTPVINNTTTYYIGICPGFFRVPLTVFVSPEIVITGTPNIIDETCAGNDGEITGLTVAGGTGNLIYDWNGLVTTTPDLTGAVGGSYTLTVTDDNGCSAVDGPYVITPTPGPVIDVSNVSVVDESCNGNDGAISGITVSGTGLTYEWNGQTSTTLDIANLQEDDYTLVVTDGSGCTSTAGPFTVNLVSGPIIDASNVNIVDENCGDADGSITNIVASGTGLVFEWNGQVSTLDQNNLTSGTYNLTVTDVNGCSSSAGPFIVDNLGGPVIDVSNLTITNESCDQGNGSITGITINGNFQSITWNGATSNTADLTNAGAGFYTIEVTDNSGCSSSEGPFEIENVPGPIIDDANLLIVNESCDGNDGAITGLNVSGNNLIYAWNGNLAPSPDLTGISAGQYTLAVTDDQGCVETYGPITITQPSGPVINDSDLEVIPVSCDGQLGSITGLTASGTGLQYIWNNVPSTSIDNNGLSAGGYLLEVVDANNCSAFYGPINVFQAQPPSINILPFSQFEIFEGDTVFVDVVYNPNTGTETIEWFPQDSLSCVDCLNPFANPSETTVYEIVITDSLGCEGIESVEIIVIPVCEKINLPNIFSPNFDGKNDELCFLGGCVNTVKIEIFNRWGEKVYYSEDPEECWDGRVNGIDLDPGVYVFQANGTYFTGKSFAETGTVTIVK